eukprot:361649-Chlamydomonas_euryale.AAC.3
MCPLPRHASPLGPRCCDRHARQPRIRTAQVLLLQLTLSYASMGLWAAARGTPVEGLPLLEIDAVVLAADVLQLAGVLAVVRSSLPQAVPRWVLQGRTFGGGSNCPTQRVGVVSGGGGQAGGGGGGGGDHAREVATSSAGFGSGGGGSGGVPAEGRGVRGAASCDSGRSGSVWATGTHDPLRGAFDSNIALGRRTTQDEPLEPATAIPALGAQSGADVNDTPPAAPAFYHPSLGAAGRGAAAAAAALSSVALLAAAMPSNGGAAAAPPPSDLVSLVQASGMSGLALLVLDNALVAPITEELVFRGLLLPALAAPLGSTRAAAAACALAFAGYHLGSPLRDLAALTLLGGALGWAMVTARGNLFAPTVGHVLYNAAALAAALAQ